MSDTVFDVARVTIELVTAFRIGTGRGDDLDDAVFVVDCNGLPTLPGSSLAGVLRHAVADMDRDIERALFGFQDGAKGATSRVEVSWGHVHDAQDRPVPFRGAGVKGDPVLEHLAAGEVRDHVAIDAFGGPKGRGKFDERVVPAGARFTFELVVRGKTARTAADLVGLLASPQMRLGGRTRSGLGRFRVVRALRRSFDLKKPDQLSDFCSIPRGLHEPVPPKLLPPLQIQVPKTAAGWVTATLALTPEDYWMFGGGTPCLEAHRKSAGSDDLLDSVPVTEARVVWANGTGSVQKPGATHRIPASGLKGALRHRLAFHARCRAREWARPDQDPRSADDPAAVTSLLGSIKDDDAGRPGRILFSDGRLDAVTYGHLDHVSLDRFTQGARDHLLFGEAPLFRGELRLELAVRTRDVGRDERELLARTLADLTEGRLAVGAARNRGHGYCRGRITWSDDGAWIGGRA